MEWQVEGLLRGGQFMDLLEQQCVAVCKKYDLKKIDVDVLYYLYRNPEKNTAGDIRCFLKINKGYVSQVVDHLCKQGYLQAEADVKDRRYIHYFITEKTENINKDMQAVWDQIGERVFAGISEEERQLLIKIAQKINQNMMEIFQE